MPALLLLLLLLLTIRRRREDDDDFIFFYHSVCFTTLIHMCRGRKKTTLDIFLLFHSLSLKINTYLLLSHIRCKKNSARKVTLTIILWVPARAGRNEIILLEVYRLKPGSPFALSVCLSVPLVSLPCPCQCATSQKPLSLPNFGPPTGTVYYHQLVTESGNSDDGPF